MRGSCSSAPPPCITPGDVPATGSRSATPAQPRCGSAAGCPAPAPAGAWPGPYSRHPGAGRTGVRGRSQQRLVDDGTGWAERAAGISGAARLTVHRPAVPSDHPGTPGGSALPAPPRSPSCSAPRPGGCANRYGAASDWARSRPPLKPRVDGRASARERMRKDGRGSNVLARPVGRTCAAHSWTADGLSEYQAIVLEQSFVTGGRRLPLGA